MGPRGSPLSASLNELQPAPGVGEGADAGSEGSPRLGVETSSPCGVAHLGPFSGVPVLS